MQNLHDKEEIELMKKISKKLGERITHCKCNETVRMLGRPCDWCQEQQAIDYNFAQNFLDMLGGE